MSKSTVAPSAGTEIVAGVTTFFAMAYVAFANPAILKSIGLPPAATFLWTCVMAALASGAAGYLVRLPTALACGMGLNAFAVTYATTNHIKWELMLVTCSMAGIAVFLLSIFGARRVLIDAVPRQIILAIKAGVGAVLTSLAFHKTTDFGRVVGAKWAWFLFFVGLAIIIAMHWWYARRISADKPRSPDGGQDAAELAPWVKLVYSSGFLVSIVVVLLLAWRVSALDTIPLDQHIWWAWFTPGAYAQIRFGDVFNKCLGFGLAAAFLLMLDIAGSPVDFVSDKNYNVSLSAEQRTRAVGWGFRVDSFANIIAPLAGVTPLVYYIENHVGWHAGARTGRAAAVVAVLFLIFAAFGAWCLWTESPITQVIAPFCAMPTLFFVGLSVIAGSFVSPPAENLEPTAVGIAFYHMPAAVTVVLASITTLDTAIAAGIIAYGLIRLFPKGYLGYMIEPDPWPLGFVYFGAVTILALSLFG